MEPCDSVSYILLPTSMRPGVGKRRVSGLKLGQGIILPPFYLLSFILLFLPTYTNKELGLKYCNYVQTEFKDDIRMFTNRVIIVDQVAYKIILSPCSSKVIKSKSNTFIVFYVFLFSLL